MFQRLLNVIFPLILLSGYRVGLHNLMLTRVIPHLAIRILIHLYQFPFTVVSGRLQFRIDCMALHQLVWLIHDKSKCRNVYTETNISEGYETTLKLSPILG